MSVQPDQQSLQAQRQQALHVYQEMLTAVPPEVRSALESLHDLMRSEVALCRSQCSHNQGEV